MKKTYPNNAFEPASKEIRDVFTLIWKGRQKVGFVVQNNPRPVFLTPENVNQNTGIGINEVEILVGSRMRPVFYQKGEKMFNGQTCLRDNMLVRSFRITPSGTIEQMRDKRVKQVPLHRIQRVFTFQKGERELVGLDIGKEEPVILNANSLQGLTRIDPADFEVLTGSCISPEYYQAGEELEVGGVCRKSNTLVKNLNLRFRARLPEMIRMRQEEVQAEGKTFEPSKNYEVPGKPTYQKHGGVFGYDDETIEFGFLGDPTNLWFED